VNMGRKKAPGASTALEPFELRPFCYYCDREFDTVKTLIQHQRTKHLACSECGLKFDTVTGLRVHMLNAYKKTMKEVPGAIPGRENPDIVVHGMEGVPKAIMEEKTKKALAERAEKEKARADARAERPESKGESGAKADADEPRPPDEPRPRRVSAADMSDKAPLPPPMPSLPPQPGPVAARASASKPPAPEAPAPPPTPAVSSSVPAAFLVPPLPQAPAPERPVEKPDSGSMPGLSPVVAQLLSGGPSGDKDADAPVRVPGLPGHKVPAHFSSLHPVALQVLAAAGVLLPALSDTARNENGKRPTPDAELVVTIPHVTVTGGTALSATGPPPVGLGVLGGSGIALPGGLGSGLPSAGGNLAFGQLSASLGMGIGLESKRPRLEGLQPALVVAP